MSYLHHNCTIVRTFVRTHSTLNLNTGESVPSHSETVTEPCNAPLFGKSAETGICRACASGWEAPGNLFASELIVCAYNAHDDLLAALKSNIEFFAELYAKYQNKIGPFASQAQVQLQQARAAIAKAEQR